MFGRRPLPRTAVTGPSDQVRPAIRRRTLKIKLDDQFQGVSGPYVGHRFGPAIRRVGASEGREVWLSVVCRPWLPMTGRLAPCDDSAADWDLRTDRCVRTCRRGRL